MLDFMLCILKQSGYIQQGIPGDFFNKLQGDLCRVSLTLEESRKIRSGLIASDKRHSKEVEELNSEISRLKAAATPVQSSESPADFVQAKKNVPNIEKSQLLLLLAIEKSGGICDEMSLVHRVGGDKVQAEFDLGELVSNNLIESVVDVDGDVSYKFTQEGRRALIQSRLNHE